MAYYSKCLLLLLLGWWQICTMLCTFSLQLESCLIKITFLSTVSSLLQPCNVSTCVYTACATIVIIQFIYKALGLNEPVLHLRWACSERALHNVPVPDGSQSVSQSVLVVGCAIFPPSSHGVTAQEDWQLTQHVPCLHSRETMRISNMTASTTSLITRDKSQSLMCNLWWCDLVMHCIAVMSY